jgi:hypothetical protein
MFKSIRRRLAFLGGAGAVSLAIMLGSAAAAQADCTTNDMSSPCHWSFGAPDANSPNVYQQSGDGNFDVVPTNTSDFQGWLWNTYTSSWNECSFRGAVGSGDDQTLCSSVSTSTKEHAESYGGGTAGYTWLYFPTS